MEAKAPTRSRCCDGRLDLTMQNFRDSGGTSWQWTTQVRGETASIVHWQRTKFTLTDEATGAEERRVEIR